MKIILPLKLGEITRITFLLREAGIPAETGAASILYDKLINVLCMFILICSASFFTSLPEIHIAVIFAALPLVLFLGISRNLLKRTAYLISKRIGASVETGLALFDNISTGRVIFLIVFTMVFLFFSPLLTGWFILNGLSIKGIPLAALCVRLLMIEIIGALPLTTAGFGAREASYLIFLAPYGTPSQLLAAGLTATFIEQLVPAFAGVPWTGSFVKIIASGKR